MSEDMVRVCNYVIAKYKDGGYKSVSRKTLRDICDRDLLLLIIDKQKDYDEVQNILNEVHDRNIRTGYMSVCPREFEHVEKYIGGRIIKQARNALNEVQCEALNRELLNGVIEDTKQTGGATENPKAEFDEQPYAGPK